MWCKVIVKFFAWKEQVSLGTRMLCGKFKKWTNALYSFQDDLLLCKIRFEGYLQSDALGTITEMGFSQSFCFIFFSLHRDEGHVFWTYPEGTLTI